MKTIKEMNLKNKKVILRCDLNVSIKDKVIVSDERIVASLETIKYLLDNNSKIIILSHLGKVKTEEDKEKKSLLIVYNRLKELLPNVTIYFSPVTRGKELENYVENLESGQILLVENTRFEDLTENKESNNDIELSKYWSSLGDIFIDDAFGMSHRKHASNNGIKKYLPYANGFLIEKELNKLEVLINPQEPFTVIMGGAKVEDKSLLIKNILKKSNYLLLGGGIANTFLAVNYNIGKSLFSSEYLEEAKELLSIYIGKIILPIDVVVENDKKISAKKISEVTDEDIIYDIGPLTIEKYKRYIEEANTIFMNGTVGLYENKNFEIGTKEILKICSKAKGKVVLGGGDAVTSAEHFKITDFYHLSTGGGATLDYIGNGKLLSMEVDDVNNS